LSSNDAQNSTCGIRFRISNVLSTVTYRYGTKYYGWQNMILKEYYILHNCCAHWESQM